MSARPWRCLWRDVNSDVRIVTLPETARLLFLSLIPELEDDGSLRRVPGMTLEEQIAATVKLSESKVTKALPLLVKRELLSLRDGVLRMVAFAKRQLLTAEPSNGTDGPVEATPRTPLSKTERQRRWREGRRERLQHSSTPVDAVDESVDESVDEEKSTSVDAVDALPSQTLPSEKKEEREEEKKAKPSSSAGASAGDAKTVTESVTDPLGCPRLRDVLDAVSHWSKGRISEIVTTADGADLKAVIETLYERDRIVLHDYELLGAWACKQTGGPGFPTLRKPPSWNFLLGDDRKGSRLVEALGEARHWERLQDEKEKRCG